jgi:hypothetical protein
MNSSTGTMEFALRDPDGYYVMISALGSTSIKGESLSGGSRKIG